MVSRGIMVKNFFVVLQVKRPGTKLSVSFVYFIHKIHAKIKYTRTIYSLLSQMTRDADMIPTKESGAQYGAGIGDQYQV